MTIRVVYVLIALVVSNCSDSQRERSNSRIEDSFLDEHSNVNFSEFKGWSFFIRSGSLDGSKRVFVSDFYNSGKEGVLVIEVNKKGRAEFYESLMKSDRVINIDSILTMAEKFDDFKVRSLENDSLGNVYISFYEDYKPSLIRVSDKAELVLPDGCKLAEINNNWFRCEYPVQ